MKTGKSCNRCNVALTLGENWSDGLARSNSYMCRACNSAKGKAHYALNAQKYLDMQRERLRSKEGAKKRSEYSSEFYAKNKNRWVGYRAAQKAKENSDAWARSGRMLIWIRRRAAQSGMDFDLTREWISQAVESGACAVTGIKFDLGRDEMLRFQPWSPSVDRIDSSRGYTQDNCRVVCWIYNMAKSEWSDDVVMTFAKALAAR